MLAGISDGPDAIALGGWCARSWASNAVLSWLWAWCCEMAVPQSCHTTKQEDGTQIPDPGEEGGPSGKWTSSCCCGWQGDRSVTRAGGGSETVAHVRAGSTSLLARVCGRVKTHLRGGSGGRSRLYKLIKSRRGKLMQGNNHDRGGRPPLDKILGAPPGRASGSTVRGILPLSAGQKEISHWEAQSGAEWSSCAIEERLDQPAAGALPLFPDGSWAIFRPPPTPP